MNWTELSWWLMFSWLTGCFFFLPNDSLAVLLTELPIYWQTGSFLCWFLGSVFTHCLVCWLEGWQTNCLLYLLIDWLAMLFIVWLLADKLTCYFVHCMTSWVTDYSLKDWASACYIIFSYHLYLVDWMPAWANHFIDRVTVLHGSGTIIIILRLCDCFASGKLWWRRGETRH